MSVVQDFKKTGVYESGVQGHDSLVDGYSCVLWQHAGQDVPVSNLPSPAGLPRPPALHDPLVGHHAPRHPHAEGAGPQVQGLSLTSPQLGQGQSLENRNFRSRKLGI